MKITIELSELNCETKVLIAEQISNADVLLILAKEVDSDVKFAVSQNEKTSAEALAILAEDEDESIRLSVAYHKNTSVETLDKLAEDNDKRVSDEALDKLAVLKKEEKKMLVSTDCTTNNLEVINKKAENANVKKKKADAKPKKAEEKEKKVDVKAKKTDAEAKNEDVKPKKADVKANDIISLKDERLVLIDPTSKSFFDNVLGYVTEDKKLIFVTEFVEAIKKVKAEGISPFWKPIYDPSLDGNKIVFKAGRTPATHHSYNFWKQKVEKMPTVEGIKWKIGTEYQYYAFLTWLINQLISNGQDSHEAIETVAWTSKTLGHYYDDTTMEKTGERMVCGVCDLGNTSKLLERTNKEIGSYWYPEKASNAKDGGFWVAGFSYNKVANYCQLSELYPQFDMDGELYFSVGWLVLS